MLRIQGTMVDHRLLQPGYCSESERAKYVRGLYEDRGVPPSKLSIVDHAIETGRDHLAVQEAKGADLSADEFGAFRILSNELVNDHAKNYYCDWELDAPIENCVHLDNAYVEQRLHPETMSSDSINETVAWRGGHQYVVIDDDEGAVVVNLDPPKTDTPQDGLDPAEPVCTCSNNDHNCGHIATVVAHAADTWDLDNELSLAHMDLVSSAINTVQNLGSGTAAPGDGGSSSEDDAGDRWDGSASFDGDEDGVEAIEEWVENYANVESDLDPEGIVVSSGAWDGEDAYKIETVPFETDYWDSSNNEWSDKDGWESVQEAFRKIMQNNSGDDGPIRYFGEPDYVNILPEDKLEELVG